MSVWRVGALTPTSDSQEAGPVRCPGFASVLWTLTRAGNFPRELHRGTTVILMRFQFGERKSGRLRANPKRGIGFEYEEHS
jgi:hypothetical protein